MLTMEKTAPRRQRRTGGFPVRTPRRAEVHPKPLADARTDSLDAVYVVKVETRSGDTGHPLVIPPALAVEECYRTKDKAVGMLREIAARRAAHEVARAAHRPSPATLNIIPCYTDNIDSLRVLTVEGMIVRYFIVRMPLV